ncbi:MAG: redoxin domain-containing protein [Candidatus Eisenbacteria bacterium]
MHSRLHHRIVPFLLVMSLTMLTNSFPGAARADEESRTPVVGDIAPDFALPALSGGTIRLSSLVKKGPVVLLMLRGYPGYQCPFCTKQVGDFLTRADGFKKAKAHVVFVYPGPSEGLWDHAKEFVQGRDYPRHFYVLPDPGYTMTDAYHLRWDAEQETSHPALFVLDRKGRVTYARISEGHGDRVAAEQALEVLAKP